MAKAETKPVDKHTRAPQAGRLIVCPQCSKASRVYHFAWSALACINCGQMVSKKDFLIYSENEA